MTREGARGFYLPDINGWVERISKVQNNICQSSVKISSQCVDFDLRERSPVGVVPERCSLTSLRVKVYVGYNVKSMSRKVYSLYVACTC